MNIKSLSVYCLSLLIVCNTLNASEHTNTSLPDNKEALTLYVKYGKPFCYVCLGSIMTYLLYNWYIDKTSITLHSVEPCQPLPIHNTNSTPTKRTPCKVCAIKQSRNPDPIINNTDAKMRPTNYLHPAYGQPTITNAPQEEIVIPEESDIIQQTSDIPDAKESVEFSSISNESNDTVATEATLDNFVDEVTATEEQIVESVAAVSNETISHEIIVQEGVTSAEASDTPMPETFEYTQEVTDISSVANESNSENSIRETEDNTSDEPETCAIIEDTNNKDVIAPETDELEINTTNNQSSDSTNIFNDTTSAELLPLDSKSTQELTELQEDQSESNEQLYRHIEEDTSDENTDTDDTDIFSNADESTAGYDSDTESDINDFDDGDYFEANEDDSDSDKYNAIYE